jgi:hypothetical protein
MPSRPDTLAQIANALMEQHGDQLAALIAHHLRQAPPNELVGVAEAARIRGCSVDTIYRHAQELGGEPAGGGKRGKGRPLRFDPERLRPNGHGASSQESA